GDPGSRRRCGWYHGLDERLIQLAACYSGALDVANWLLSSPTHLDRLSGEASLIYSATMGVRDCSVGLASLPLDYRLCATRYWRIDVTSTSYRGVLLWLSGRKGVSQQIYARADSVE